MQVQFKQCVMLTGMWQQQYSLLINGVNMMAEMGTVRSFRLREEHCKL